MPQDQSVERVLGQFGAKLDNLTNEMTGIRDQVRDTHDIVVRNEMKAGQIAEKVEKHDLVVEDYKKTKARGLGIISGIFAAGTFAGLAIDKLFAFFRFGGQG